MLIIGYSDTPGARLQTRAGWGMNGWAGRPRRMPDRQLRRYGLRNTNPILGKRRLHNGNLYRKRQRARCIAIWNWSARTVARASLAKAIAPWTWGAASSFASDAAVCLTLIGTTLQPQHGADLHPPPAPAPSLVDGWRRQRTLERWRRVRSTGCTGVRASCRGDYNAPGNRGRGRQSRATGCTCGVTVEAGTTGAVFGSNIAKSGRHAGQGSHGRARQSGMRGAAHRWHLAFLANTSPGRRGPSAAPASAAPVMIRGQYGMQVDEHGTARQLQALRGRRRTGPALVGWNPRAGDGGWRHSADFGADSVAAVRLCALGHEPGSDRASHRQAPALLADGASWHEERWARHDDRRFPACWAVSRQRDRPAPSCCSAAPTPAMPGRLSASAARSRRGCRWSWVNRPRQRDDCGDGTAPPPAMSLVPSTPSCADSTPGSARWLLVLARSPPPASGRQARARGDCRGQRLEGAAIDEFAVAGLLRRRLPPSWNLSPGTRSNRVLT